MKIIAIDLGTTSGYAIGETRSSELCVHGTKNVSLLKREGAGMRYLKFHHWIVKLLRDEKPDLVVWEEVRAHKGPLAAHIYGGLQAHLLTACEGLKIRYEPLPVGTIKKHATGNGNANKEMMIKAAKNLGYKPNDDNDADAILMYRLAKQMFSERKTA